MKIELNLVSGVLKTDPTKEDMQKNIDSLERCLKNKKEVRDDVILLDTITILQGIQKQLK